MSQVFDVQPASSRTFAMPLFVATFGIGISADFAGHSLVEANQISSNSVLWVLAFWVPFFWVPCSRWNTKRHEA